MNRAITVRYVCWVVLSLVISTHPLPAEEADRTDNAIRRALAYLLTQQKDDGSIHSGKHATAMTGLATMAFCATGHQPTDPTPEGAALRKALEFMLRDDRQQDNGYFGGRDGSRMYGHGIVTLALAELLGMGVDAEQDTQIRTRLRKALDLILTAQDRKKPDNEMHYGGWRYQPDATDSDLSVTVWQLMALRSAQNAGVRVPEEAIRKAVRYLRVCFKEVEKNGVRSAAFVYMPDRNPTYSSASIGLLAMQVCGEYESDEVQRAADWLKQHEIRRNERWFSYATYYFAQGMHQRGGDYADYAKRQLAHLLLEHQESDGSWKSTDGQEQEAGHVYATSLAVLSLSVYYHYLPIYQR
jgi:hypothetical protein